MYVATVEGKDMTKELTGGCLCGAVRYVWRPTIRFKSYACHCTDCQKRTGTSFALQQMALESDLEVQGELAEGGFTQPSGARSRLFACPKCQSRIYGINSERPGFVIIRAGGFDHNQSIIPDFHVWTQSKQPWISIPEETNSFKTQPESTEQWSRLLVPDLA